YFGVTADMIPLIGATIKLDGVDCGTGMWTQIGGFDIKDFELVTEKVKVGARVRAVWRRKRQGNFRDIDYWKIIE
ncbi:MAG: hypothetical protein V3V88_01525, partial [Dehalococcoidia bacterium]